MPVRSQFKTEIEFRGALRDWFAGQALIGILACPADHRGDKDECDRSGTAYAYADAMMGARNANA